MTVPSIEPGVFVPYASLAAIIVAAWKGLKVLRSIEHFVADVAAYMAQGRGTMEEVHKLYLELTKNHIVHLEADVAAIKQKLGMTDAEA